MSSYEHLLAFPTIITFRSYREFVYVDVVKVMLKEYENKKEV